jgi:hypothetical protein
MQEVPRSKRRKRRTTWSASTSDDGYDEVCVRLIVAPEVPELVRQTAIELGGVGHAMSEPVERCRFHPTGPFQPCRL